ncbi:hypothetical protein C2G38_2149880 [Gigaspora rosea]|uniref:BTB/POZ domain-containing protein n=1 Tax=Gigaspora rosea TaxID=44941 RepID=A0A397U5K1_9GLOM|nr:hypothetical protein C2G38_2149880 [Gigaspora rosea]
MVTNFFNRLSQDFTKLLENEYDYNVIIEIGENPNVKLFKTHSAILSQRCPYFLRELDNIPKNGENVKEIKIKQISVEIFSKILKYIYGGNVSLEKIEDPSEIFKLLIISNQFGLDELVAHVQTHLTNRHLDWIQLNIIPIHRTSFKIKNFEILQKFCTDIVVKNPELVFDMEDFDSVHENALVALLEHDGLNVKESVIWDYVIKWGMANKATLNRCLSLIRYFQIPGEDIMDKVQPYRQILDPNVWSDIMSKFVPPGKPAARTISNGKLISPATPSPSNSNNELSMLSPLPTPLFSNIISKGHAAEIASWIDRRSISYDFARNPYEFKLLFRGSRDGFNAKAFHSFCDNKANTIIVLKVKGTDEIIGGYNPIPWNKGKKLGKLIKTNDSFLFSLDKENIHNSVLSRVKDPNLAFWYSSFSTDGPNFGNNDLVMMNNFKDDKKCRCKKSVYEKPIRNTTDYFSVEEFEAFQVNNKRTLEISRDSNLI